jgi:hypothetical protein
MRKEGKFVMTRGQRYDMGPGLSHKTTIIDLYLKNYTFTEIEQKTNHSETRLLSQPDPHDRAEVTAPSQRVPGAL